EVTPVPMPNTVVKLSSAHGSWGSRPCKSRTLPSNSFPFHSSSVVEQSAVNRSVVGSNPTCGAIWRAVRVAEGARLEIVCAVNAVPRVQIPRSPPPLYIYWPVGQAVKTPPFHGGNTGSNPVRVTNYYT